MRSESAIPENVRDWLMLMQNPYAKLSLYDDDFVDVHSQKTDFEPPLSASVLAKHPSKKHGATKKEFEGNCRRIFLQYIPPSEGRVLRPHYRDFIIRNENNSPELRARILEELNKYDLSSSGNFQPHFNREREFLTVEKLQKIEKAAQKPS